MTSRELMGRSPDTFPAPFLLGLTGPGGAGKSTIARALENVAIARGYVCPVSVHIGGPLKAMLSAFYAAAGLPPVEAVRRIDGDLKRAPCALLGGRTPTEAQQALGTGWGRKLIASDLWLDLWRRRAEEILQAHCSVINESVRYENEAAAIRDRGGIVVRLTGRESDLTGSGAGHCSEAGVDADFEIPNVGTPVQVAARILNLIEAGACRVRGNCG